MGARPGQVDQEVLIVIFCEIEMLDVNAECTSGVRTEETDEKTMKGPLFSEKVRVGFSVCNQYLILE